jgi:hypothetical protein
LSWEQIRFGLDWTKVIKEKSLLNSQGDLVTSLYHRFFTGSIECKKVALDSVICQAVL